MKVNFKTNLDLAFPEYWPEMDFPPPVGSYVESRSGLELQVVRVTFRQERNYDHIHDHYVGWLTYAEVELHLGPAWKDQTIGDFNRWDRERKRKN